MKLHPKQLHQESAEVGQTIVYSGSWMPYGTYAYVSDESEDNTSSESWQQVLRLTTPSLPEGYYEINWQGAVRTSWGFKPTYVQIYIDDTVEVLTASMFAEKDMSSNQRLAFNGSTVLHMTSGTHNIDMDFRAYSSDYISYIYSKKLFIREFHITSSSLDFDTTEGCDLRLKQIDQAGAEDDQKLAWDGLKYSPYGYIQDAESTVSSSTTSSTYQQKLRLTTPSTMPYGTYMVYWHWTWYYSINTGDAGFRVQLDDTTTLQEWEKEPKDSSTDQDNTISGFYRLLNISGSHDIDVDYKSISAATTGIQKAYLIIEQVDIGD